MRPPSGGLTWGSVLGDDECDPIKAVLSVSTSSTSSPADQFGPNEWLVEEMYQRFLDDPRAVDPAWHEFFADYRPADADGAPEVDEARRDSATRTTGSTDAPAKPPARPTAKSPAKPPRSGSGAGSKPDEPATNGRAGRPP